jgi:Fe-S-cluster containining protein
LSIGKFKCARCGLCCAKPIIEEVENKDIYKKIPIYPEEAELLEELAKENNVPLRMIEDIDACIPDTKNKKIIVTRYTIIIDDEDNNRCPFSIGENCSIYDNRPLVCRAYPISMRELDAFQREIFIDDDCTGIKELRKTVDFSKFNMDDIKAYFPIEYRIAVKLFDKEKQIMFKLKEWQHDKKINLNTKLSVEEFDVALREWDRIDLFTDRD